jgi:serine acetyltransferase
MNKTGLRQFIAKDDFPADSLVAGNPARVIRSLNERPQTDPRRPSGSFLMCGVNSV